ncbi:hypothetical protein [Clostridium brassicae]|uniref:ABC transporter permease n=1 Tax=Clostridium brassicae TaxID=2999072 RepID=A0ABT4DF80_9CLOT|nr:hypothetical protein [Clostridium brassicae]MCY6959659.1 hypothetical protein [Clostridium brassicae]
MKTGCKKFNLIILSILSMILISTILNLNLNQMTSNIKDMYIYYYSYTFLSEKMTILNILISSLPMIISISIFADDLAIEIEKNAAYIFTRSRKRKKWIVNKFIYILFNILRIEFIQFSISFVYFTILGYRIKEPKQFLLVFVELLILNILTQYILIIIVNLVTLKINNIVGYIICIFLFLINIITFHLFFLKEQILVKYIPLIQYLLSIKENMLVDRSIIYFSNFIPSYNFIQAVAYDVIIIIFLLLVGRKIIEKYEFY